MSCIGSSEDISFGTLKEVIIGHTFQGSVKCKASRTDNEVAKVCDEEYSIMAVLPTIEHALEGEIDEQYVGQCVDDLRRVMCCIVVFFTPVQS